MLAKKALFSTLAVLLLTFTSQVYAQTQSESANEQPKTNEVRLNSVDSKERTNEQPKTNESYAIHYNALNTTFLEPKVAEKYKINRSKNRAMLTVSVRKGGKGQLMQTQAVEAEVTAQAANLAAQLKTIDMRQVPDGDAIYYIGTFSVTNKETLKFTIKVEPENQGSMHEIKFSQQFFVD